MVNVTPEQWAEITEDASPRYQVAECSHGMWGVRDNSTGSLVADHTGHIVFKFEHNARLMAGVMNDRS